MTNHRKTYTALFMALLLMFTVVAAITTSCSQEKKGRLEADTLSLKRLRALDDSVAFRSPMARAMAEQGMKEAKDSAEYYEYYIRLGKIFLTESEPDSATAVTDRTLRFLERQEKDAHTEGIIGFARNCKGVALHSFRRQPKEAIRQYRLSYEALMRSDRMETAPDVCANLADAYSFDSDLPNAAVWYRRALFLVDSLQLEPTRNITLYMGLGRVYMMLEDYKSAKKYLDATEKMYNLMSPDMRIYLVTSIGNYHYYKKEYKEALKQFVRLEKLHEQLNMEKSYSMFICKVNMADVLLNLNRLDEAGKYVAEADTFFTACDDAVALYYTHSVELGLAMKRGNMAEAHRLASLNDTPESVEPGLKAIRNKYKREYYETTGNYRMAFSSLSREMHETDSLVHNRQHMIAAELMNRFTQDTLQLHHQIQMQHKENDVREAHYVIAGAVGSVAVLMLVIAYGITYIRKKRLAGQMKVFTLRLQNARNRISPHFVFNVLNNRITTADGTKEADELLLLSKLIRQNLDLTGKQMATLEEELDFVENYVNVERKTIGDDFEYSLTLGDGIDRKALGEFMIPSMTVQILVENSIKHALRGKAGKKLLHITVRRDGRGGMTVTVGDNGNGFDIRRTASTGQGLDILRTTISVLNQRNKRKTSLTVRNVHDTNGNTCGCEASISFPQGLREI